MTQYNFYDKIILALLSQTGRNGTRMILGNGIVNNKQHKPTPLVNFIHILYHYLLYFFRYDIIVDIK